MTNGTPSDVSEAAPVYVAWEPGPRDLERLETWVRLAGEAHAEFVWTPNESISAARVRKPHKEWTVALVTTAGVHPRDQLPFDVLSPTGDPSFREISRDTPSDAFCVSDTHFDTSDAEADINCLFPIDRLRELERDGAIGRVSPLHVGFMGFAPNPRRDGWLNAAAAAVALLRREDVDVALLTPG